jgi:hypothetical protein
MKAYWGMGVWLHAFLTSALGGGEWPASRPGRFTPKERAPGTHWIGGWVGPRGNKFICSDRLWSSPSLLSSGYPGLFPGVKRPGREADHLPPSSTEVKECVALYLHSPNAPSWRSAHLKKKHRDHFSFTFLYFDKGQWLSGLFKGKVVPVL